VSIVYSIIVIIVIENEYLGCTVTLLLQDHCTKVTVNC